MLLELLLDVKKQKFIWKEPKTASKATSESISKTTKQSWLWWESYQVTTILCLKCHKEQQSHYDPSCEGT